ncbi:hypothetical protein LTR16_010112, partial [Cryomyces antarcticus]
LPNQAVVACHHHRTRRPGPACYTSSSRTQPRLRTRAVTRRTTTTAAVAACAITSAASPTISGPTSVTSKAASRACRTSTSCAFPDCRRRSSHCAVRSRIPD